MYGGCLKVIWRESGGCLEVSKGYLGGVQDFRGVSSDRVKSGQVRKGQARNGQAWKVQVRKGQVRSGNDNRKVKVGKR